MVRAAREFLRAVVAIKPTEDARIAAVDYITRSGRTGEVNRSGAGAASIKIGSRSLTLFPEVAAGKITRIRVRSRSRHVNRGLVHVSAIDGAICRALALSIPVTTNLRSLEEIGGTVVRGLALWRALALRLVAANLFKPAAHVIEGGGAIGGPLQLTGPVIHRLSIAAGRVVAIAPGFVEKIPAAGALTRSRTGIALQLPAQLLGTTLLFRASRASILRNLIIELVLIPTAGIVAGPLAALLDPLARVVLSPLARGILGSPFLSFALCVVALVAGALLRGAIHRLALLTCALLGSTLIRFAGLRFALLPGAILRCTLLGGALLLLLLLLNCPLLRLALLLRASARAAGATARLILPRRFQFSGGICTGVERAHRR